MAQVLSNENQLLLKTILDCKPESLKELEVATGRRSGLPFSTEGPELLTQVLVFQQGKQGVRRRDGFVITDFTVGDIPVRPCRSFRAGKRFLVCF